MGWSFWTRYNFIQLCCTGIWFVKAIKVISDVFAKFQNYRSIFQIPKSIFFYLFSIPKIYCFSQNWLTQVVRIQLNNFGITSSDGTFKRILFKQTYQYYRKHHCSDIEQHQTRNFQFIALHRVCFKLLFQV